MLHNHSKRVRTLSRRAREVQMQEEDLRASRIDHHGLKRLCVRSCIAREGLMQDDEPRRRVPRLSTPVLELCRHLLNYPITENRRLPLPPLPQQGSRSDLTTLPLALQPTKKRSDIETYFLPFCIVKRGFGSASSTITSRLKYNTHCH